MNADASALVVRYSPEAREHFQSTVVPALRRQTRLSVVLAGGFLALIVGILLLGWLASEVPVPVNGLLFAAAFAVLSVLAIIRGVRKLRRPLTLPDVVLTITDDQLILGRFERMTFLGYSRPELHWDRRTTQTEYRSGNGLFTHDRITFTHHESGRRRTQNVAVATLDTSAEEILAAMQRP